MLRIPINSIDSETFYSASKLFFLQGLGRYTGRCIPLYNFSILVLPESPRVRCNSEDGLSITFDTLFKYSNVVCTTLLEKNEEESGEKKETRIV